MAAKTRGVYFSRRSSRNEVGGANVAIDASMTRDIPRIPLRRPPGPTPVAIPHHQPLRLTIKYTVLTSMISPLDARIRNPILPELACVSLNSRSRRWFNLIRSPGVDGCLQRHYLNYSVKMKFGEAFYAVLQHFHLQESQIREL